MTPEEGYRRAQFQRPGVRIVMGAVSAREEITQHRRPGDPVYPVKDTAASWFEYDCARLIGAEKISLWCLWFCVLAAAAREQPLPAREDVAFFACSRTGLAAAQSYVLKLKEAD